MGGVNVRLTPHGRLLVEEAADTPPLDQGIIARLTTAFAENTGQGLL